MNKQYQVKLTLEGSASQIEHTLLAIVRTLQVQQHYTDKVIYVDASGYEDILIHSELKEI